MKLSEYLRSVKDNIMTTVRTNVQREKTGYSEYTWWYTTVSFDEVPVIDFEKLMNEIEKFENSFKGETK